MSKTEKDSDRLYRFDVDGMKTCGKSCPVEFIPRRRARVYRSWLVQASKVSFRPFSAPSPLQVFSEGENNKYWNRVVI